MAWYILEADASANHPAASFSITSREHALAAYERQCQLRPKSEIRLTGNDGTLLLLRSAA